MKNIVKVTSGERLMILYNYRLLMRSTQVDLLAVSDAYFSLYLSENTLLKIIKGTKV